jgi:hypothetical protein
MICLLCRPLGSHIHNSVVWYLPACTSQPICSITYCSVCSLNYFKLCHITCTASEIFTSQYAICPTVLWECILTEHCAKWIRCMFRKIRRPCICCFLSPIFSVNKLHEIKSSGTNSHAVTQEILCLLRNPKVHYCFLKNVSPALEKVEMTFLIAFWLWMSLEPRNRDSSVGTTHSELRAS